MWDTVVEFKQTAERYRGRFAPSPTGPLHLGSLMVALGSWLLARREGGDWLIRIEDVDRPREVTGAADLQLATLAAFGLESDEQVIRQSTRGDLYAGVLQQLVGQDAAFACACSRSALAATSGVHRACVQVAGPDHRAGYRLRVADGACVEFMDVLQGYYMQDVADTVGDFILLRSDQLWAYQLAVVIDDFAQGINAVVRGADLLDSTPRQILLQRALHYPAPSYLHLPMVLDPNGRKLSKSLGAAAVDPRQPLPAMRLAWQLLGQDAAVLRGRLTTAQALRLALDQFDPVRLPAIPMIDLAALHNGKSATRV